MVIAAHEEGCCVAVTRKEIWATLRMGGPTRVVAKAASSEQQPIAILGQVRDRLIYRDADAVLSVPVMGGPPQRLGTTAGDWRKTFIGSASPDGTFLMALTVDPSIWSVVTAIARGGALERGPRSSR